MVDRHQEKKPNQDTIGLKLSQVEYNWGSSHKKGYTLRFKQQNYGDINEHITILSGQSKKWWSDQLFFELVRKHYSELPNESSESPSWWTMSN